MRWAVLAVAVLVLQACGSSHRGAGPAGGVGASTSLECAPFARQATGIQLYGEAAAWWDQAEGRYERGQEPVPGGVLVFRRSGRLPSGHVSVVSKVLSEREILVTQANWVRRRITRDEPVVDVSPGNDWSAVRVWWAPSGVLGSTTYAAYGFIAPSPTRRRGAADLVASAEPTEE